MLLRYAEGGQPILFRKKRVKSEGIPGNRHLVRDFLDAFHAGGKQFQRGVETCRQAEFMERTAAEFMKKKTEVVVGDPEPGGNPAEIVSDGGIFPYFPGQFQNRLRESVPVLPGIMKTVDFRNKLFRQNGGFHLYFRSAVLPVPELFQFFHNVKKRKWIDQRKEVIFGKFLQSFQHSPETFACGSEPGIGADRPRQGLPGADAVRHRPVDKRCIHFYCFSVEDADCAVLHDSEGTDFHTDRLSVFTGRQRRDAENADVRKVCHILF